MYPDDIPDQGRTPSAEIPNPATPEALFQNYRHQEGGVGLRIWTPS